MKKNSLGLNFHLKILIYERLVRTQNIFNEKQYLSKEDETIFVKPNKHQYSYFHTKPRNIIYKRNLK